VTKEFSWIPLQLDYIGRTGISPITIGFSGQDT
jgi:hypothetical protein